MLLDRHLWFGYRGIVDARKNKDDMVPPRCGLYILHHLCERPEDRHDSLFIHQIANQSALAIAYEDVRIAPSTWSALAIVLPCRVIFKYEQKAVDAKSTTHVQDIAFDLSVELGVAAGRVGEARRVCGCNEGFHVIYGPYRGAFIDCTRDRLVDSGVLINRAKTLGMSSLPLHSLWP